METLQRLGYTSSEWEEPYSAMAELCRQPLIYRSVILSLASLYREELAVVRTIKRRFAHVEVWLAHTDGRQASLAEAMRLGADGLLDDDGLHRVAIASSADEPPLSHSEQEALADASRVSAAARADEGFDTDYMAAEPILSADELKALLQEQPTMPPSGDEES